jgi:hypothetical protein
MTPTIGIVVHADQRDVFTEAARPLRGAVVEWVVYRQEHEIRGRVAALLADGRVDALLLGPLPYDACGDLLPDTLTTTVVRPAALDLSLALSRAQARHPGAGVLSVDTFDHDEVVEVTDALGMGGMRILTQPYTAGQDPAAITERHLRALEAADGVVVTGRMAVARALRGRVPVVQSTPVPSTVRAELHGLALRAQSHRARELRFSAGVFVVTHHPDGGSVDQARTDLAALLCRTPEFADTWMENRGRRGVLVFAHMALLERATRNWVAAPVLGPAERRHGLTVAAGFGIGSSARTCVALAERAAARAESDGRAVAYLLEDSGVVIGPMGPDRDPVELAFAEHGTRLEVLAGEAGLSPATLSRLLAVERTLSGQPISPSDLANTLGITDPSGRRLVRKLAACRLAVPEGSAQTHRRGRPTTLFRLGIEQALSAPAAVS